MRRGKSTTGNNKDRAVKQLPVDFEIKIQNSLGFLLILIDSVDSGSSGPGSGPGRGHCVVFLGKTLYSHSASLHPGV